MKKFLILLFTFLTTSMLVPIVNASTTPPVYSLQVYKVSQPYPDYLKSKDGDTKRLPSYPLLCEISESEGVSITGYPEEILYYEIWDAEGELCQAVFANEAEFIATLFSMQGDFQIRFITDDYYLIGYISINY